LFVLIRGLGYVTFVLALAYGSIHRAHEIAFMKKGLRSATREKFKSSELKTE